MWSDLIFLAGFICNCLSYFTTAKISFTLTLYPQFTHMIFIMYTLHCTVIITFAQTFKKNYMCMCNTCDCDKLMWIILACVDNTLFIPITRNMIFAVTHKVSRIKREITESRNSEGVEAGVIFALLRRVTLRSKQNRLTSARQNTATRHDSSN